jgi:hypothetical protein
MTPAQLIAYDAIDKLEVAVRQARRQMESGDFAVSTLRMLNLIEHVEDALSPKEPHEHR